MWCRHTRAGKEIYAQKRTHTYSHTNVYRSPFKFPFFLFTFHHYIYVSMCVYVYVHISLFLPECACTTIIDTSPWIFSLMYCCCVSITFVNCIWPPGALIWLINLFLFLFLFYTIHLYKFTGQILNYKISHMILSLE